MDDFGSGYSSLDVLQDIHFDLIKLDMRFMHRFDEGPENRIIVTELVKMALALGVETVCEGVETREQAEFLREVGCTKLQGYYFCRPISMEQILERYRKGVAIGFENPDEAEYFAAIGRINLYDLTAVSNDSSEKIANFFDTLPMAVVECDAEVPLCRCGTALPRRGHAAVFRRDASERIRCAQHGALRRPKPCDRDYRRCRRHPRHLGTLGQSL